MKFDLVVDCDPKRFVDGVNQNLAAGFQLIGPPVMVNIDSTLYHVVYLAKEDDVYGDVI